MKEALRTDGNTAAWQVWYAAQDLLGQVRQPAPLLVFPGEQEIFRAMYAQVGEVVGVVCFRLVLLLLVPFLRGNLFSQLISVVDRPCLALVRQCRIFFFSNGCMAQRKSLSGRSPFCQR